MSYKEEYEQLKSKLDSKKEEKIRLEEQLKSVNKEIEKEQEVLETLGLKSIDHAKEKYEVLEKNIQEQLGKVKEIVNS